MGFDKFYRPMRVLKVHPTAQQLFGTQEKAVLHVKYDFALDGGLVGLITPAINGFIPANAIITGVAINATTAVLAAAGAATVAIGTSAGSSANSLLTATAKGSFTVDVLLAGIPVPSDATKWVKMSAAGQVTITVATNPLTAGVVEIWVEYLVAAAA